MKTTTLRLIAVGLPLAAGLLGTVVFSSVAPAQSAPALAFLDGNGALVEVRSNGGASTVFTPAPTAMWIGSSLTPSVGNRGVAMLHETFTGTNFTTVLSVWESGQGTTTLATMASAPLTAAGPASDLIVDQDGDYLVANGTGLFRVPALGGVHTTVATGPFVSIAHDLRQGGWICGTANAEVVRITPSGSVTTITNLPGPAVFQDMHGDPVTGDVFYADGALRRFVHSTRSFSTIAQRTCFSVDVDPADRNLIVAGVGDIVKIDRSGAVLQTLYTNPSSLNGPLLAVAALGSRHVGGITPAIRGTTYRLMASFPSEPGQRYAAAASLGFTPGIPTTPVAIPLQPDAMLALSFAAPQLFQSFAGVLNSRGENMPSVNLPGFTLGLRLYFAVVTIANGRVRSVSEPLGVTVR